MAVGLVGITMAVSSFTRRAWHAAVGTVIVVMGWSVLGSVVGDGINTTRRFLYSPMGWLEATVFLPFEHRFPYADCAPGSANAGRSWCAYEIERMMHAESTIFLAHTYLILAGIVGITIAWLRIKRMEGAA